MSGGFGSGEAGDPSAQTPCTGAGRGRLPLGSPAGSSAPQAALPSQTLALLVTKGTVCSCPCPGHTVSTGWARADLAPATPGLSPGNWHQKPPRHPARDTQGLPSLWHRLEAARPGCPHAPRPHGGSGTPRLASQQRPPLAAERSPKVSSGGCPGTQTQPQPFGRQRAASGAGASLRTRSSEGLGWPWQCTARPRAPEQLLNAQSQGKGPCRPPQPGSAITSPFPEAQTKATVYSGTQAFPEVYVYVQLKIP